MGMIIKVAIYIALAFYALSWLLGPAEVVQTETVSRKQFIEQAKQREDDEWERLETVLAKIDNVGIQDPNLKACIKREVSGWSHRIKLGLYTFPNDLTELNCSHKEISSLKGIGYLANLKKLDLKNNSLTDVSELINLTRLESLNLSNNDLFNLNQIQGLSKLQELEVYGVKVNDVTVFTRMRGLKKLSIYLSNDHPCTQLKKLFDSKSIKFRNPRQPEFCISRGGRKVRF